MAKKGKCDWCGVGVPEDEGIRLLWPKRNLGATFDRLEHVVPWIMQKNDWHIWDKVEVPDDASPNCSQTGEELDEDTAVYLVKHRGEARIPDGFVDLEAALAWAKAGGRFSP